jgi:toxin ParE1/3/4
MHLVWLPAAVRNLLHAREYIRQDNPAAAEKTGARIEASINNLAAFPMIGRSGEVPRTRELVIPGLPYLVIYRVQDDTVYLASEAEMAKLTPAIRYRNMTITI